MNSKALIEAATAESRRLHKDWAVDVSYDLSCLMAVIGALQLSLRHPEFRKKPSAHIVRHIIAHLMAGIPEDMPATRELARLGDNPQYDT